MRGRYLHSDSPTARRAAAIVYSVATGAAVFDWTAAGGWPALRAGKIIDPLFLLISATMIWWLVAGVGLRVVGRFDASRRDASPAEDRVGKPAR